MKKLLNTEPTKNWAKFLKIEQIPKKLGKFSKIEQIIDLYDRDQKWRSKTYLMIYFPTENVLSIRVTKLFWINMTHDLFCDTKNSPTSDVWKSDTSKVDILTLVPYLNWWNGFMMGLDDILAFLKAFLSILASLMTIVGTGPNHTWQTAPYFWAK